MSEVKTAKRFKEMVSLTRAFRYMTLSKTVDYSLAKSYLRLSVADAIAANLIYDRPVAVHPNYFIDSITSDAALKTAYDIYCGVHRSIVDRAFHIIVENYSILKEGGIPDEVYSAKAMMDSMLVEIDRTVSNDIVPSAVGNAVGVYVENVYKRMSDDSNEYDFADAIINDLDEHQGSTVDIDCVSIHINEKLTNRVYRYIANVLTTTCIVC